MKKLKLLLPCILTGLLFTSCTANKPAAAGESSAATTSSVTNTASSTQTKQTASTTAKAAASNNKEIAQKTKEFILNGQKDKPEAEKLKWSEAFLNQVNIESVYKAYLTAGGKADDVKSFADYLTKNAPVPNNWKELFEADLLKTYGEKVSKYEQLPNDFYKVYVKMNGSDVPYVTVNARTGSYHG